jgi:membrane-bound metal-dependent hydrolase YbcI (DUF457 family)
MILGHLTVTSAAHRILKRHVAPSLVIPLGPLLVGAYLPDLVDKPLAFATGLAGRGYGHSVVVQAALFAAIAWPLRRHARVVAAVALGALLHLLEDWEPIAVLLAPLLGPIPYVPQMPLLDKIVQYYTSRSPQMWIEVVALVYWLAVGAASARPWASLRPPSTAR